MSTYGALAIALKSSPRAVGQVLHHSVPWPHACFNVLPVMYAAVAVSQGHTTCCSERLMLQALRRNPYAPKVPCHRVVAHDLKIGGFSGTWVRVRLFMQFIRFPKYLGSVFALWYELGETKALSSTCFVSDRVCCQLKFCSKVMLYYCAGSAVRSCQSEEGTPGK